MGIPGGILIDSRGPRWGVLMGSICLAAGYIPLKRAYDIGPGGMSVAGMCFFSLLTGVGSCTAFSASLKVCATNWPRHRGTATGLPLGAFGLSAFFYTAIAAILFPNDASGYLGLLAFGTTTMTFVGMFFLGIVPQSALAYTAVARKQDESPTRPYTPGAIARSNTLLRHASPSQNRQTHGKYSPATAEDGSLDETSSLVGSSGPSSPGPGDLGGEAPAMHSLSRRRSHSPHHPYTEITGWALVRSAKFWQLFLMLSLLAGVGLMTINNIGNNARALWHHYDDSASKKFIQSRQMLHVSILSIFSFLGRLASGIGSDIFIHRGLSRFWTLVVSSCVFTVAQICALNIENPNNLFILSSLSGMAYGILFGVYPALVADAFGSSGMGINWGCMTWAPVLSANAFNLIYGTILDAHSIFEGGDGDGHGERTCDEGRACYQNAYWVTLIASLCGVAWSLYCVGRESLHSKSARERRERRAHEP